MVGNRMQGVLLATLMVSIAFAGCFAGNDTLNDTTGDIGLPDLGNLTADMDPAIEIPPCHLTAGSITWPDFAGAPPISEPVTVTLKTDAYGVTHIYADDLYSLFYANGFVQASDRFFQMDILRQVGYGESSKYLGPGQLSLDEDIHRSMYTREEIQAQYDAAPEEGKEVLQAFADGVNRWMAEAVARDEWPAEFAALGRAPPPWSPVDSVALINYLIGYFGVDGGNEARNLARLAQLESTLGEVKAWDALEDWVWLRADDTYTSISTDDLVLNGCEDPLERDQAEHQLLTVKNARLTQTFGTVQQESNPTGGAGGGERSYFEDVDHGVMDGFKWGSNALVVDGSTTDTGKPIMWGAPQMGYYKPPVPYQIGLHAPAAGFDAVGIGVAGAPGIVIGRNAHIAWTATSGIEDQVDLVEVELTGARTYLWDGVEKTMDCWNVEHQILPTATNQDTPKTYTQEVCRAEGWPVVAINEQSDVAYLQKTTTRNEELMGALKWLQAPTATSIDEFRNIMADFPFTFNYLIASDDGVAQIHTGNVPLRAPGYDPRLPTPSGSAYDWTGEAYTAQMQTWITDPSRGYIANWNNAPVYGWRTGDQPGLWGPVQRVQQIEYWIQKHLDGNGTISFEDVQDINWKAATHDSHALPFMPLLIDAAASDPELADVHDALVAWFAAEVPWRDNDGDGLYDDPAHAIWDAVQQEMLDRVMGDELGTMVPKLHLDIAQGVQGGDHGGVNTPLAPLLKALRGTTNHDWCNDVDTAENETCEEQLVASLRQVQTDLTERFGTSDVSQWLEPVHMNQFIAFGAFTADERPMVNRGSWVQVVSMAEPERSVSIMPPGNSGLITPAELAIQQSMGGDPERLTRELDMYWNNQYKPFPLTAAEVDAVATQTAELVVLSPA